MANLEESWIDYYLPEHLLPRLEGELIKFPNYRSPIATTAEINEDGFLEAWCISAFSCIRNFAQYIENPTYFVISRAPLPSAMVCKYSDFQCIIITSTLYENLTRLTANLLTNENLFNFLIHSSEPTEGSEPVFLARKDAVHSCANHIMAIETAIWNITHVMVNYSAYFIVAHELAHLLLGHMDQAEDMAMVEFEAHTALPTTSSRANEWQADSFASVATLFRLNSLLEMQAEAEADWLQDSAARVRFLAVMCYLIFTSMDFMEREDWNYDMRTHPSPMSRAGLTMATVAMAARYLFGIDMHDTHTISQKSFKAVEVSLINVAGGGLSSAEASRYGEETEKSLGLFFAFLTSDKVNRNHARLSKVSWSFMVPGVA